VRLASAAAVAVVGLMIGGCAETPQEVETVTVEREVAGEPPSTSPEEAPKPRSRSGSRSTGSKAFVDCDENIQAKAVTTTCPFAQNVFWAYWTSGESSSPLQVWSPPVQASFAVTCKSRPEQVICTTRDDATVRFPQASVDAYSQTQADAYASGHDLGPDPYEGLPDADLPPSDAPRTAGGQDCQGYDPCIPPGADVDCGSGSGNGPRYVDGPVYLDGSDPYGLDSDGDGIACE
jgi:hypothetical protein